MNDKNLIGTRAIKILAMTVAITFGSSAVSQEYEKRSSPPFCQPRTRCTDYEVCYINNISQPCAWGRGGATLSAIFFEHGTFYLEWLSKDDIEVIYGDKKQYKTKATVALKDGQRIYTLADGVTFQHPSWTIPLHLVGEETLP
jgi:hypothetical protein